MKFEEFNLDEKLIQGLTDAGYIECMPVQEQTLKETLNRRDAAVQSQTGTGKTAAFLISVLQHHQEKDKNNKKNTYSSSHKRALLFRLNRKQFSFPNIWI